MRSDQLIPYHITSIFTSRMLLFFAVIFLFISLLAHQMELTALMLFVLFLPGAAYLWSRFAFSHLTFDFQLDKTRVFPGDPILVNISVTNNKLLPVWIQINSPFDDNLFFYETPPKETAFLLWFQTITIKWHLNPSRRGCFCIGQTNVIAADLFGFFPRQKTLKNDSDIIVFPKQVPTHALELKKNHFFGNPGSKSPVQDPVYIIGTREYQNFTPVKFIHWKASARLGLLQEKICEPSIQGKVLFIVDVSLFKEYKAEEAFEQMLETVASMAIRFKRLENAVGFLTNATINGSHSPFVPFGRNSKTLSTILETIARMGIMPENDMQSVFQHHASTLWGFNCIFACHTPAIFELKMKNIFTQKRIPITPVISKTDSKNPENIIVAPSRTQHTINSTAPVNG